MKTKSMARLQARLGAIAQAVKRLPTIIVLLALSILLSGCVHYDVGINFAGQNHGEIVQHIRVDEQLTTLSGTVAQDWLKNLEQRTRQLGGRVQRVSKQELIATIPFNNGAELQEKFNQFFSPDPAQLPQSESSLPAIVSHLTVTQRNFLLVEKNHLTFDLDLRSLGVLSSAGSVLISPGNLLNLEFSLDTPWGATNPQAESDSASLTSKHLVWTPKAGDINHIEATFWVPSPLGIGSVAIALIVVAGMVVEGRRQRAEGKGQKAEGGMEL